MNGLMRSLFESDHIHLVPYGIIAYLWVLVATLARRVARLEQRQR